MCSAFASLPTAESTAEVAGLAATAEFAQVESVAQDEPAEELAELTDEPAAAQAKPTDQPPTATRRATNTPRPTNTARPTATERPTNTSAPTATRIPPTATLAPSTPTRPLPTAPSVPPTQPPVLPTATSAPAALGESAVVTAVIDGDTIDVSMGGASYRVRYIGMDTPEVGQTCGSEATQANAALVAGQTVRMVRDVSETDRFGRLLRYVYVGNTFVNGALVAGGWAVAKDYPPDTAMSATLHGLMNEGTGRGCALVAAPLPTEPVRAPDPVPIAPPPPSGNCHPSYPTVCIPPPPPDLDCGDITHRRFQVVGDDPHRFDSDGDGIGCESG